MKKILVAVDGSKLSAKVLQRARAIAEKFNSEVLILTVAKRIRIMNYYADYAGSDYHEWVDTEIKTSSEKTLDRAKEEFKGYQGKFEALLSYGEPAEEILVIAEREKPDLLVMGSRGLGGFGRVMLGSVSTKVLHHVTCDMLVVRDND